MFRMALFFWILMTPMLSMAGTCKDFAESACRIDVELHQSFIKKTGEPVSRLSVADPKIADVNLITPTQVLITARDLIGATSLTLWHGDERAEVYMVKTYASEALMETIRDQLRRLAPGTNIQIIPTGKSIILDGDVESQEMLDRVLRIVKNYISLNPDSNLITLKGHQQVQLEVRIAEVSRSGMKQMGLSFLNNRNFSVGVFQSGQVRGDASATYSDIPVTETTERDSFGYVTQTTTEGGVTKILSSAMNIASPYAAAFQVAVHALEDDTLAILSLLKSQGLTRLLASPTLVTMSGQEADFLVGGEYPYPVQGDSGRTIIQFKRFGVMLRFTPVVVGKETLSIRVQPEVSSLDFSLGVSSGGVVVPGLRTRRGATTLQLKDGQTFAMAGLLNEETRTVVNKIPFLGDLPFLGTLFSSKEFQKNESELVIIVTPRLVRAMNPEEVPPLPGEKAKDHISDVDFFLWGFIGEAGFSR